MRQCSCVVCARPCTPRLQDGGVRVVFTDTFMKNPPTQYNTMQHNATTIANVLLVVAAVNGVCSQSSTYRRLFGTR